MTYRRVNSGSCGVSRREIFGEFTFVDLVYLRGALSWQSLEMYNLLVTRGKAIQGESFRTLCNSISISNRDLQSFLVVIIERMVVCSYKTEMFLARGAHVNWLTVILSSVCI